MGESDFVLNGYQLKRYSGQDDIVTVPDGIRVIGARAFENSNVEEIVLHDSVVQIDDFAFINCTNLKRIKLPPIMESIGAAAFCKCISLKKMTIPFGITTISEQLFSKCESLKRCIIPDSVTSIAEDSFAYCSEELNFTVSPDNPRYTSDNGSLIDKTEDKLMRFCNTGEKIPQVTRIGPLAFSFNSNLSPRSLSVYLPPSVRFIEPRAFFGCRDLNRVFMQCVEEIGECAFERCYLLETAVLNECIKSIDNCAFCECTALKSIILPEGTRCVGDSAFNSCSSLKEVYVMNPDVCFGKNVFDGCNGTNIIALNGSSAEKYVYENTVHFKAL